MRTTIVAVVVALAGLLPMSGCFKIDEPPCAYSCVADNACPSDYTCAADGYCHKKGYTGTCTYSTDDGGGDLSVADLSSHD